MLSKAVLRAGYYCGLDLAKLICLYSNIEERTWMAFHLQAFDTKSHFLLASEKLESLVDTLRELRHLIYGIWIDLVFMHNAHFFFRFFKLTLLICIGKFGVQDPV